jgi:biopolymer transport protein ExbB
MLANVVVDLFLKGGPIMYPIAVVTLFAICIFIERVFWWLRFTAKRSEAAR